MPPPVGNPTRGEIWLIDLMPVRGHEQAGERRPCLIVSANELNHGPAGMVFIAPITKANRNIAAHIPVSPSESGLDLQSYIMCDQIRSVSKERLIRCIGKRMPPHIMIAVENTLKFLLCLK